MRISNGVPLTNWTMINLSKELVRKERYRDVFSSLRQKVRTEPYRLESSPVNKNFTLRWALSAEDEIVSFLVKELKQRKYQPDVCRLAQVNLDKKRKLYSFSWPDRVFELVLGRVLAQVLEPYLSNRVFSFRPGYSNFQAVRELSQFVKQQQSRDLYIIKRDVANFGDTIDCTLLLEKLKEVLGKQDKYFYELIDLFIRPYFVDAKGKDRQRLTIGLPTGCSITPVLENFYLSELDHYCQDIAGGFYCRYGDDILFAHPDKLVAQSCSLKVEEILKAHKLESRDDKQRDICFSPKDLGGVRVDEFISQASIDYLGLNINRKGEVFLSSNKLSEFKARLRKTAKRSFYANRKNTSSSSEIVQSVIQNLNLHFNQQLETPHLSLLLHSISNEKALVELDRWIAKLVLRYVYGTGHDRVFRYQSYRSLRQQGLLSLVHMRRLAHRGAL